jgi:glycosyltransferase involved in cell wall biosynthesis
MTKKVFMISEIYFPEESATSFIFTKIAEALANDYEVNVITGRPDYSSKKLAVKKKENIKGVSVFRCKVPSFDKNNVLLRIVRALLLSILISIKAFFSINRDDIVIGATNPATLLFFLSIVCKLKKAKYIILVHDVFPDNLVSAQILKKGSYLLRPLSYAADLAYRSAYKVVVIGRDMAEVLKKRTNEECIVITNWADCNEIYQQDKSNNCLLKELGLGGKFIVEFAGNIGRVQGVQTLAEAINEIPDDNVHFLFVGDGATRKDLENQLLRENNNYNFAGSRPRQLQNDFLNACDVGLVSLAPGMYGLGVPSKTYNIMAAGKPIIAVVDKESEIGQMVLEEGIGWVVPPGDSAALIEAILEAKSDALNLKKIGKRARQVAEKKYSFSSVIQQYKNILR